MPIDINLLRKDKGGDPEKVRASQRNRFKDETLVDQVLEIDELWRKKQYEANTWQMESNKCNKEIGERKKKDKTDPCEDIKKRSSEMQEKKGKCEDEAKVLEG